MKKPIAIFDVDDTLIPFTEAVCRELEKKFKKTFDFNQVQWGFNHLLESERSYAVSLFESTKFIKSIRFPEETARMLKVATEELGFDLLFCTSTYTKVLTTRGLYLQDHATCVPSKNCIMTGRKDVVYGKVLFDDNIDHIKSSIVEIPVLITKPWNRDYRGFIRAERPEQYIDILKKIKDGWTKQELYELQNPRKENDGPCVISFINCGSGSGKTAVVNRLIETSNDFERVVTNTTRQPRPGEIDGRDYNFCTVEEFESLIEDDMLLEYTQYAGNYYGISKKSIEDILEKGKNAVIVITNEGAIALKKAFPNISYNVGITRNKEDLVKSIMERDVPESEKISRIVQLENDLLSVRYADYCFENISIDDTARHICSIFELEES